MSTLPRKPGNHEHDDNDDDDTTETMTLESEDMSADTSMDYLEFSSQTLPRSYKSDHHSTNKDMIKTEWEELMESSDAALNHGDMFHTLPKSYNKQRSQTPETRQVQEVLTVQEKVNDDLAAPPPAELYVNLLDDDDDVHESDADTASMSTGTVSYRPTPHITPHHSFTGADRSRPIDIAKMLDPFEQLEREFGWETGGVTIRPPSAFCSLADIEEDSDERQSDQVNSDNNEVMEAVDEAVNSLDDSGVCDVSDNSISEENTITRAEDAR